VNFNQGSLTFLSYLRQYGLALAYPADIPDQPATELGRTSPNLRAVLQGDPAAVTAVSSYSLGPGELERLDLSREVRRTFPAEGADDVSPNLMAQVELWLPELPWALMPAKANATGLLRPFMALVVIEERDGVVFTPRTPRANARIHIESRAHVELPPPDEVHLWSHVQLWGLTGDDETTLRAALKERGGQVIARLICPRRLSPRTRYRACVVPVFESGRLAGLGTNPGDTAGLKVAWVADTETIDLPVFFDWQFVTGEKGDIEELIRRLVPRPASDQVGSVALDVAASALALGLDLPASQTLLSMDGALRVPGQRAVITPPQAFMDALRVAVNVPSIRAATDLSVAPPIYGRWHAKVAAVGATATGWVQELNRLPARRAAAGLGTLIVQQHQEAFMAAAWDQLGEVEEANRLLRQAQLARGVANALKVRLSKLPNSLLLQLSGNAHRRILFGGTTTIAAKLAQPGLASYVATDAFRRLARARGPLAKRFTPTTRFSTLTAAAAAGEARLAMSAPSMPDGATSWNAKASKDPVPEWFKSRRAVDAVAVAAVKAQLTLIAAKPTTATTAIPVDSLADAVRTAFEPHDRIVRSLVDPAKGRLRGLPAMAAADPIEPVMAHPHVDEALAPLLSAEAPDLLLPGVEHIPPETVLILETNAPFIAALAAGANQEMCRELLWHGFPTDQRGTPLRRFWKTPDTSPAPALDLTPMSSWAVNRALGNDVGGGQAGRMVLLIRGELIRRFPNLHVALVKGQLVSGALQPKANPAAAEISEPLFSGGMGSDLRYWGFALTPAAAVGSQTAAAPGWFIRLQQLEDEPSFGLDETKQVDTISSWDDLSWAHLPEGIGHLSPRRHRPATTSALAAEWGKDSAAMASILFQRPVRLFVHARDLVPNAPMVTSVSASSGSTLGGETLVLKGFRFQGVVAVTFGTALAPHVRVRDAATIEVRTPARTAGTAVVRVWRSEAEARAAQPAAAPNEVSFAFLNPG
jgi:hypothetical protein